MIEFDINKLLDVSKLLDAKPSYRLDLKHFFVLFFGPGLLVLAFVICRYAFGTVKKSKEHESLRFAIENITSRSHLSEDHLEGGRSYAVEPYTATEQQNARILPPWSRLDYAYFLVLLSVETLYGILAVGLAPILPDLFQRKSIDTVWIGPLLAIFPLGIILSSPVLNSLAFVSGRWVVFLVGLISASVSLLGFGLSETIGQLLLWRLIQVFETISVISIVY